MSANHLFVYGSLAPGARNERVLASVSGHWRRGWVRGRLMPSGWGAAIGFPALIPDGSAAEVPGHLFTSPDLDDHWKHLDDFEGEEYERVTIPVRLEDGSTVQAWIYALKDRS